MKEDPEKFWDNIPHEIEEAKEPREADVPRVHTTEERVEEEKIAERYND